MDLAEGLVSKQTGSQPVPGVDVHAQSPSWKAGRKMRSSSAKYLEKRSLGEPEYPDEDVGMTTGIFQKAEKLQTYYSFVSAVSVWLQNRGWGPSGAPQG